MFAVFPPLEKLARNTSCAPEALRRSPRAAVVFLFRFPCTREHIPDTPWQTPLRFFFIIGAIRGSGDTGFHILL
jgi:hypothetical protein